ncbi:phosphatase PAP2 family protein [Paeniroseomonas aquatica]|uniref:Phosphatase PAP2 family protein n=1 Tax=Paeniroseomonas aquatica TaxID=373043 RepID=A0ABT8AAG6_9PROT|nr:phosphatase PAP2 family protein [Paeniroseomonas aquatica]MDN3566606.1 phosphatase PAP2 family protein [Paeniroseomonas aquatica]
MDRTPLPFRPPLPRRLLRLAAGQAVPLLALAVCAAGLLGFALLADMLEDGEHRFDEALMLALRQPGDAAQPIGPPWLALAMRDLTALGGIPVLGLLSLVALGYLLLARQGRAALLLLVSLPGGLLLNTLLKQGFDRPRPALVAHLVDVQTLSFPSGHAMLSAVGYLTLGALLAGAAAQRRQQGYIMGAAVLLVLLIGASRVYLGVHWPTDVLAGWCLGAAWAMGCWLVLQVSGWRRRDR